MARQTADADDSTRSEISCQTIRHVRAVKRRAARANNRKAWSV